MDCPDPVHRNCNIPNSVLKTTLSDFDRAPLYIQRSGLVFQGAAEKGDSLSAMQFESWGYLVEASSLAA